MGCQRGADLGPTSPVRRGWKAEKCGPARTATPPYLSRFGPVVQARKEAPVVARVGVLSNAVRVEPRKGDREPAAAMAQAVATPRGLELLLQLPDGTAVPLWPSLVDVLRSPAHPLADGHALTVLPSDVMLTPAEAAELLGLSRPYVVRLLDQGEIPFERVPRSRHRRVRLSDVLAFQARREQRRAGRRRVADAVEAWDLPY